MATKADIARLEARFDRLKDRLNDRLDSMKRFHVGTNVGSMTGPTAIFSLLVAFLG